MELANVMQQVITINGHLMGNVGQDVIMGIIGIRPQQHACSLLTVLLPTDLATPMIQAAEMMGNVMKYVQVVTMPL